MDGFIATRQIKALSTPTKVVLLSALADEARSKGVADCGADGFLAKGTNVREMITALREVATHDSEMRQAVDAQLLAKEACKTKSREHPTFKLSDMVNPVVVEDVDELSVRR